MSTGAFSRARLYEVARHGSSMPRQLARVNMPIPPFATLVCRRLNSRDEATLVETTVSLREGTARASDMAGHGELSCAIGHSDVLCGCAVVAVPGSTG